MGAGARALAAEREVIAVDMPGFGGSPSLPDSVRPTAANLAEATLDFYDDLGIDAKPVVAGISLGGWVAIECGRHGGAAGVVGICTAGFWHKPLGPKRSVARLVAKLASRSSTGYERARTPPQGLREPDPPHRAHDARAGREIIRGYAKAQDYDAANDEMRRPSSATSPTSGCR